MVRNGKKQNKGAIMHFQKLLSKNNILYTLILFMLIVIGFQQWQIYNLKRDFSYLDNSRELTKLSTDIENLKYKYDDHESSLNNLSADISDLNKKIDDIRISLMVGLPSRHSTYKN